MKDQEIETKTESEKPKPAPPQTLMGLPVVWVDSPPPKPMVLGGPLLKEKER